MKKGDIKYLAAYLLPICAMIGIVFPFHFSWLTPIVTFLLIPVIELFTPENQANLHPTEVNQKSKSIFFDVLLYLNLPLVYGILIGSLLVLSKQELSPAQVIGLVFSVGIILGSNGINVAHELGHRTGFWNQLFARLLLLPSHYTHFTLEHNYGHHAQVSTPEDPATAQLNQSVYSFWWSSSTGQYKNAWVIQKKLLVSQNQAFWSLKNDMLINSFLQVIYLSALFICFSWKIALWAMAMGIIGFLLLESINYLEHYGLLRLQKKSGRYVPVKEIHSWNSNHLLGRILLYELTRHSDHHYRANKKYQLLDYHTKSPELPYGYPTSILLALIPPLWFSIMNPRIPEEMRLKAKYD
ncbi:MAG: alkane 1-monooxygenase [Flavobacteriaceae bacterium]|nr:alkane 1-monooxygenase [Flavobacteriaceae bacterium]